MTACVLHIKKTIVVFILLFLPVLQSSSVVGAWKINGTDTICVTRRASHTFHCFGVLLPLVPLATSRWLHGVLVCKSGNLQVSWTTAERQVSPRKFRSLFWAFSKNLPLSLLPYLPVSLSAVLPVPGVPWHRGNSSIVRSSNAALIHSQTSRAVVPSLFLSFFSFFLSTGTGKRSNTVWIRLQRRCVLNASCNASFLQLIEDLVVQKRRQRGATV